MNLSQALSGAEHKKVWKMSSSHLDPIFSVITKVTKISLVFFLKICLEKIEFSLWYKLWKYKVNPLVLFFWMFYIATIVILNKYQKKN